MWPSLEVDVDNHHQNFTLLNFTNYDDDIDTIDTQERPR